MTMRLSPSRLPVAGLALLLAGCVGAFEPFDDPSGSPASVAPPQDPAAPAAPAAPGAPVATPAWGEGPALKVFAHDARRLFQLDPQTLDFSVVGDFDCVGLDDPAQLTDEQTACCIGMTDIAIDAGGRMIGVLRDVGSPQYQLVEIDTHTAHCTPIGSLGPVKIKGLTFAPAGTLEAGEVLVGVDLGCGYWRIDTDPVAARWIGELAACSAKGGDLVGVTADETFAIGDNHLLAIDPRSGQLRRMVGELNPPLPSYPNGGLGYFGGVIYGFGLDGRLYTIDAQTAATAEVSLRGDLPARFGFPGLPMFTGAGVTTAAPRVM